MPWVKDDIRSTFPNPERDISRRKWILALRHPATWIPPVPYAVAIATGSTSGKNLSAAAAAALAHLGAVVLFWRHPAPTRKEAAAQFDETITDLREEIQIAGDVR